MKDSCDIFEVENVVAFEGEVFDNRKVDKTYLLCDISSDSDSSPWQHLENENARDCLITILIYLDSH